QQEAGDGARASSSNVGSASSPRQQEAGDGARASSSNVGSDSSPDGPPPASSNTDDSATRRGTDGVDGDLPGGPEGASGSVMPSQVASAIDSSLPASSVHDNEEEEEE
ncbi:unnamed protein product, partial [Ectocarpus fasciculatus]